MRYSWEHGASFSDSPELTAMLKGWYDAGTEAIFVAGGSMFNSGKDAAETAEAALIGVDVDQSFQSDAVVTSAMKDLAGSVISTLTKFYTDGALLNGAITLGAADNAVGIPTDTWSLENWTVEEYNALYEQVKSGEIVVDNDSTKAAADPSTKGLDNIEFVK